jgi:Ca-activated chloride channel family protein
VSGRGRSLVALLSLAGGVATAAPESSLRIEEPAPGRYVSGLVTLRARVAPESLPVRRLVFAADGHPVCAREAPPWECAWDAGADVAAHSIRAVAVLTDGSRLVDTVRTEAAGFAPVVDVELVQVAATVTDGKGRPVKGLGREAFRVFEDGRKQDVTHFIGADGERELVVAVDMSGSMGPAMARCRDAVKRFLGSIRPIDAVTVLAFNDSVFTVSRREASPEARLRAVDRLRSWGSTAFYDAVLRGLDLLERHRGRRALVLFTDGEDMVSHATAQDVQRRIEVSASPVYVVAQGKGMREPGLKRVLDRVAGVSGGRAFYTDSVDELGGVFTEIGEDIASQYLLAYAPAEVVRDGGWRSIRVEVAGTKHAVRARQGYRATARGR